MPKLTFHGAAETVTGSKYLLEAGGAKVMIDCGMFQGRKRLRQLNWNPLPLEPRDVDAVVLTHAHIDHSGYLPRFVARGFHGPVLATPATWQLCELLLLDGARNQERDAEYANRKGYSKHQPALPLYDTADARNALKLFRVRQRDQWHQAKGPIWFRFHDAGHLLGSTLIEVEIRAGDRPLRVVFSGDVGRYSGPLYHDPRPPPACDVLICESTYGDRDHPDTDMLKSLEEVVQRSVRRGGVMVMSSFAVGRAQQLIYLLQVLMHERRIPKIPIILDSPMSVDATHIYRDFNKDHDLSEGELDPPGSVLDGPMLTLSRSVEASKSINQLDGPGVIISSSGMMVGGRILHHLKKRLPESKNTILLGGYMAYGTRGRRLQDGEKTLRIHGEDIPVRAAIEKVSGLSGHADRTELLRWLEPLSDSPPKKTFITHGELDSATAFRDVLFDQWNQEVIVPKLGEGFELSA